jgi:hypothetical protein
MKEFDPLTKGAVRVAIAAICLLAFLFFLALYLKP